MASQVITNGTHENKNTGSVKTGSSPASLLSAVAVAQNINFPGGVNVANNFNFITGGNLADVDSYQKIIDTFSANYIVKDSINDKISDSYIGVITPTYLGLDCEIIYDWAPGSGFIDTSGVQHGFSDLEATNITYNADVSTYTWRKGLTAATGAY